MDAATAVSGTTENSSYVPAMLQQVRTAAELPDVLSRAFASLRYFCSLALILLLQEPPGRFGNAPGRCDCCSGTTERYWALPRCCRSHRMLLGVVSTAPGPQDTPVHRNCCFWHHRTLLQCSRTADQHHPRAFASLCRFRSWALFLLLLEP